MPTEEQIVDVFKWLTEVELMRDQTQKKASAARTPEARCSREYWDGMVRGMKDVLCRLGIKLVCRKSVSKTKGGEHDER